METKELYTDQELFLHIAEGDEYAFQLLFARYTRLLFPFLYKLTKSSEVSEDMMQETLLKVWLKRDTLPEIEHPRSWIFRIASNIAYRYLEKSLVLEAYPTDDVMYGSTPEVDETLSLKQLRECVQLAVAALPLQRQRIYRMSREAGLTRAAIAKQLGLSEKTVKNTLHAALQSIRNSLAEQGWSIPVSVLLLLMT